jgi:hypothetical protein
MKTGLLFVFFLVFEHLRLTPSMAIVVAMSVGSLGNPSGFLALALKPDLPQQPATPCGGLMVLSFTATTVGYGGWLPLQDRMATLSTNSSHRVVPYTHNALVTDVTAAQTSIHAIRDVVHAVRANAALDKSL